MTRAEAKERALELWGEAGVITRIAIIFGLIGSAWVGVTAAKGGMESWFVTREDANRLWAQQAAKEELRTVRDSARQERLERRISYLACRIDGGTLRQCSHLRND